jgi:hypothetical protein
MRCRRFFYALNKLQTRFTTIIQISNTPNLIIDLNFNSTTQYFFNQMRLCALTTHHLELNSLTKIIFL